MLEIRNLSVNYTTEDRTIRAVDDVSFDIVDGRTLGLVGESGSGKSTVALSILKLIDRPGEIISGQIIWNNKDVLKMPADDLRSLRGGEIAMIFQDPFSSLNPVFTVGDQIGEAVKIHSAKTQAPSSKMKELLGLVHLNKDVARKYPHELSGGMRQRIMIAMALAGNPKLLIADEPTTALDVTIQAEILKLLKEIQGRFGMSIMLITHNLSLVHGFCDEICIIQNGRIVENGITEDVFAGPKTEYTKELLAAIPRPRWK
jgi:ABC-type dipeptide/oligopeptide/nickel transport system ATPase component